MKTISIILSLLVLLLIAVPVAAGPSISSISPTYGYTGTPTTVTISGTELDLSSVGVKLMKDSTNISDIPIVSHTASTIACTFPSDLAVGTWSLIVWNKTDSSESNKLVDIFIEREAISLSSVSPVSGRTNNVSAKISVVGEGLSHISGVFLYSPDYTNSSAKNPTYVSATRVNATLDLTGKSLDTYQVCVVDNYGTQRCGLSFKVTSDAVGSIEVSSSPSGATFYLDGVSKGTTPITLDDLDAGTYKIMVKKDGYADWMRAVTIKDGTTASYTANLEVKTTATTATPTSTPTTIPTSIKVTRKQTSATPTPWPSDTPTPASPLDALVIVGGIGLALVALRRK